MSSTRWERFGACTVAIAAAASMILGAGSANAAPGADTGSSSGSDQIDWGKINEGIDGLKKIDWGSVDSIPGVPKVQNCNENTKAGGAGVTETTHFLGRPGPTSFVLDYETENIPDDIKVFYQGKVIYDTGYVGDNINEGTGSVRVNVPAGLTPAVTIRVSGPDGTEWSYLAHCPR